MNEETTSTGNTILDTLFPKKQTREEKHEEQRVTAYHQLRSDLIDMLLAQYEKHPKVDPSAIVFTLPMSIAMDKVWRDLLDSNLGLDHTLINGYRPEMILGHKVKYIYNITEPACIICSL